MQIKLAQSDFDTMVDWAKRTSAGGELWTAGRYKRR